MKRDSAPKIMSIWHFIRHFFTYMKFYFTNWRYKKYGFRRFKYNLHIEKKDKDGNTLGFNLVKKSIIIYVDYTDIQKLIKIPVPKHIEPNAIGDYRRQELPFTILRDEHRDLFIACDHLTYKEII